MSGSLIGQLWKIPASSAAIYLASLTLCSVAVAYIYNAFFHPLAKFPGPKAAGATNALYSYWYFGKRSPYKMLELHEKYGPVVRVAPNEVSFNSTKSWKDIYGFRQDHQPFIKSDFYDGVQFVEANTIVNERDPKKHAQYRKYVSNAFSDRSLMEQEEIVSSVIDRFMVRIGETGSGPEGVDFCKWFEIMAFDIIGDLAFGETFGGVESGKTHQWIALLLGAMKQSALGDTFKRFPFFAAVVKFLLPGKIKQLTEDTKIHENLSIDLVNKRINKVTDRKDFMTRILEHRDSLTDLQLASNAADFVLAGSETTATALSTIFFYLLRTPKVFEKLQAEIRGNFKSYSDINGLSTMPLKYLHAVISEGLRIFPPLPFPLPRVVPPGGDTVDGHYVPAGTIVSTSPIAASLSSVNFSEPYAFVPERWLEKNDKDNLNAAQPFSLGARGCLGRSLAMLELRTTISKMIFVYDFELLDNNLDWQRDARMTTLWIRPSLPIRVIDRGVRVE